MDLRFCQDQRTPAPPRTRIRSTAPRYVTPYKRKNRKSNPGVVTAAPLYSILPPALNCAWNFLESSFTARSNWSGPRGLCTVKLAPPDTLISVQSNNRHISTLTLLSSVSLNSLSALITYRCFCTPNNTPGHAPYQTRVPFPFTRGFCLPSYIRPQVPKYRSHDDRHAHNLRPLGQRRLKAGWNRRSLLPGAGPLPILLFDSGEPFL